MAADAGAAMILNQITIPATDLARSVEFYSRLGLVLIVDALPRYARFESPEGGATLSLHRVRAVAPDSGFTVYLECSPLDQVVARLRARGIRFESGPVDQKWLWREAHLRDPDQNRICLYQAGANRRFPPWRIPPRVTTDPLIPVLDEAVWASSAADHIRATLDRARRRLDTVDGAMAWDTLPLETFGDRLPESIRSCWIFVIRAGAVTGAERHPNSHQRSLSLLGRGTFEIRAGDRWSAYPLVSEPGTPPDQRWVTIPVGAWHRLFAGREPWGMISFHTTETKELIEERPVDAGSLDGETVRERYSER